MHKIALLSFTPDAFDIIFRIENSNLKLTKTDPELPEGPELPEDRLSPNLDINVYWVSNPKYPYGTPIAQFVKKSKMSINIKDKQFQNNENFETGSTIGVRFADKNSTSNIKAGILEGNCLISYDPKIEKGNGESKTFTITNHNSLVIDLFSPNDYDIGGQYAIHMDSNTDSCFETNKTIAYPGQQVIVKCVRDTESVLGKPLVVCPWGYQVGGAISFQPTYTVGEIFSFTMPNYSINIAFGQHSGGTAGGRLGGHVNSIIASNVLSWIL